MTKKNPQKAPADDAPENQAAAPAPAAAPEPAAAPATAAAPEPAAAPPAADGAPIKRKRGRPPGSAKGPVSPSEAGSAAKRGRPSSKAKTASAPNASALAKQMVGIHAVASMATGIPELQITHEEAAGLADAVLNVCAEYDLSLSGKTGAMIQLVAAMAMIYAPRVLHLKARIEAQKKQGAALQVINGGAGDGDTPAT